MNTDTFLLHHKSEVDVACDSIELFAHLDDHRRLASHMEKPSLMMAGALMQIETDQQHGRAIGSIIRMHGKVLGMRLALEEVVTEYSPPVRKVWETRGIPELLVIGAYRMGFTISSIGKGSHLVVFIDYQLPSSGLGHWLGKAFGRAYAAWCTRRMTDDAAKILSRTLTA